MVLTFHKVKALPEVGQIGGIYFVDGGQSYICTGESTFEIYTPDRISDDDIYDILGSSEVSGSIFDKLEEINKLLKSFGRFEITTVGALGTKTFSLLSEQVTS